jgi:hypothetical protein
MYQAGVKNITLYENHGITFRYYDQYDLSKITDLQSLGSIILIENIQRPTLDIESKFSNYGRMAHSYKINFLCLGLTIDNLNLLNQIAESIYGWCFLVEFYDGTFKFYHLPIYCRSHKIKPHDEMSFEIEMNSALASIKTHLNYTAGIIGIPVYRWDSDLITFDNAIYTFDYEL